MPVIIRRPHAYDFLMERFADRVSSSTDVQGSDAGLMVGELELPIPGFYLLDPQGKVLGKAGLTQPGARADILALLREKEKPLLDPLPRRPVSHLRLRSRA